MTTLRKVIDSYNLDLTKISQNRSDQNLKRLQENKKNKQRPLNEILHKGTTYKSDRLAKRLIQEGYKEKKCEECGITEWMGKPIVFHLHHEDGDHNNNELDNLKLLCPNCHSQTDTYAGKNTNKIPKLTKEKERKKAQRGISEDGTKLYDGYGNYKILCPKCKINFMHRNAEMCKECRDKERKIPKVSKEKLFEIMKCNSFVCAANLLKVDKDTVQKWYRYYIDEEKKNGNIIINSDKAPSREELKEQLIKFKSFSALGQIYGVNANSVKKWCDTYNLPRHISEIKSISDEEWEKI